MQTSVAVRRVEVHVALAAVAVFFSLNYIIGKIGLRAFEPFAFAWLRVCGSVLLLRILVSARRSSTTDEPMTRRDWGAALLFSALGVGINQLMFLTGLSLTSAHEAAILITTIPIFTLIGAFVLRTEVLSWLKVVGIALAAAGAVMVIGFHPASGAHSRLLGDIFILINCCSYGLYLVVSRPMFRQRSALTVVAHLFSIGAITMLPFCVPALLRTQWRSVPPNAWWALAGVIVGPTVAAYLLSAWALARAESSVVAAYTYVQPFLASLLAAIFLNEELQPRVFVATVLIIAGVAISTMRRPEAAAEAETSGL